ncbi:MAG: S8 family serine peptidase [Planctomycetes bacterium]|nr:S8 family serine peptidase [Planctomycetota bacterium]
MSIQPPKVAVGIGKNVSERLEIVEASGIKDEDAEILQTSTLELPTLQDVLLLAKVIDRASGDVVGVALNKAGQTLDVEQAKRDEINAYNLAYGKLHHKLVQRIANAKNDELFAVAIWLETPDTSAAIDNVKAAGYDFEGNKPVGERVKEAKRLLTTEKGKIYSPANKVIENAIVAIGGNIDYTAELSPLVFATMTAAQIQVAQALPGIQRIYESPELVKKMGTAAPATQNNDMVTAGHTGTASTVLGIVDSLQPVWFGNQYLNHLNGSVYRRWYVVTVSNPTGVNAARVDVTFTVGAGGDLVRFGTPTLNPDAAPVCGAPAFSTAGLTATVNWAANCVDAGSAVTFRVNTLKGPLTFSAGQWQNAAGANLGPALVAGNVTITEEFDEHATNCTGCAAMKQAAGDPAYPAGAANGMAPDINAISANFLTNGAEISGNMANFVAAVEWAITNNADLLNMSIGESISDLTFDVSDKYVDHIVFEHFIAVCVAASNECNPSAIREPGAGGNGICNTTAVGDDVQVILPGAAAAPNATLITRGPNNVMDTLPNGDDIYFALNGHVCQVTSPGLAYNAITVGAIDDLDTAALGDDVRAAYSCWIDLPGDSEKPEVSAPGSRIRTATANTADADGINNGGVNGTSFATPIVSGYLANMMDMDATLTPWPETTKAIALASTKRNVYDNAIENLGPVNWDKREDRAPFGSTRDTKSSMPATTTRQSWDRLTSREIELLARMFL